MSANRVLGRVGLLILSLAQVAGGQTIVWMDTYGWRMQAKDVNGGPIQTLIQFDAPPNQFSVILPQVHFDPLTAKLYFLWTSSNSSFERVNVDGSNRETITTPSTGIFSLNVELRRLYWTGDWTAGFDDTVNWSELDGSGFGSHTYTACCLLTVEGIGDDLFLGADGNMGKGVWRADADGSNEQFLRTTEEPVDLAYDPVEDKLYLTTVSDMVRLNTDGSGYQVIVFGAVSDHVAVDYQGRKVYWMPRGNRRIQRADLDGSNIEDFVTHNDVGNPNFNPQGLTIVYNTTPMPTLSGWGLMVMSALLLALGMVLLTRRLRA
jgi:hypothetical protein